VVEDNSAPNITAPADVSVPCDGGVSPNVTGVASATDACDDSPVVSFADTVTTGDCPQVGCVLLSRVFLLMEWIFQERQIMRVWTATDRCGNTANATQIINVSDDVPPVITVPANATVPCDGSIAPAATGRATATDACGGRPRLTFNDTIVSLDESCPQNYDIVCFSFLSLFDAQCVTTERADPHLDCHRSVWECRHRRPVHLCTS
jgi:hypothetical protein